MSKVLLKITTSINGEGSISNGICNTFVAAYKEKFPDAQIIERDLQTNPAPHVDAEACYAGYTPEEARSESQKTKFDARIALINEILSATDVIIATPMWNWNCPSVLKAYIDNIVMPGVLSPGMDKFAGKKFTFCVSQGGSYSDESGKGGWDYLTGYLVMFAKALGASDIELIFSEFGLAGVMPEMAELIGKKEESIAAAKEKAISRANQD